MDLIAITQTIRRHKLAALPVIVLTAALAGYAMFMTKPDYQADGSYALVAPPSAPTPGQIAQDPALGKVNPNNPLVSYGDLSVVGQILTETMGTQATQRVMLTDGIDPRSTVTNSVTNNAPIISVTGAGTTAAGAVRSGMRLGKVLSEELNTIQARLGVSSHYRITVYPLGIPDQASLKVTSKLRDLALVLVLGLVLLWVSVSVAVGTNERKQARALAPRPSDEVAWRSAQDDSAFGKLGSNGTVSHNGATPGIVGSRLAWPDSE